MTDDPSWSDGAGAADAAGAVIGVGGRAHPSETTAGHRGGALPHRTRRSPSRPCGGGGQRARRSRRRSVGVQRPTGPTAAQPRAGRRVRRRDGGGVRRPVRSVGLPVRGRRGALLAAQPEAGRCRGQGRVSRPVAWEARRSGGRLRATVRRPRIPHREPGPTSGEPVRAGPGRCGQLGGDVAGATRSSMPASSPTRSGSSVSRTSTSSVGSGREDSTCWSTPCRLGPWPINRRRPAEPEALGPHRPTDERETWRSYYHARNSILLARRHGRPSWHVWHLAYSARHLQKATGNDERKAILQRPLGRRPRPIRREPRLRPDRGRASRGERGSRFSTC